MRHLINNTRFSVRFCFCMEGFGIKTIGQAKKMLDKCNPNVMVCTARASTLKRELNEYIKDNKL